MKIYVFLLINLSFIVYATAVEDADSDVIKAMMEHEVIPDVINQGPKDMLKACILFKNI